MITILTPTYNRVHTLERLYSSLCEQIDLECFEWLIIDDGSSDETFTLIEKFKNQNKIPIRYIFQENRGKHVALNNGIENAKYDWIFIVDSDDTLTIDAISTIKKDLILLESLNVVGFCYRRAYFDDSIIGKEVKTNETYLLMSPSEAGKLLVGDLAYIFKKEIMRKNLFPVIPNEKFVPELYIWNKIHNYGKIAFFITKSIYKCEYLEDGYTKNFKRNLKNNPIGFLIFYSSQIFYEKKIIGKIKCIIRSFECIYYNYLKQKKQIKEEK